jgi:hypothetical protein
MVPVSLIYAVVHIGKRQSGGSRSGELTYMSRSGVKSNRLRATWTDQAKLSSNRHAN